MTDEQPVPFPPLVAEAQRERLSGVGEALRRSYREAVSEDVPESLIDLLRELE